MPEGEALMAGPPHSLQGRFAERHQGLAVESAAEQQQARCVFAPEQNQRLRQLAAGGRSVAGTACEQAEMQAGHGE